MTDRQTPEQIAREIAKDFVDEEWEDVCTTDIAAAIRSAVNERLEMAALALGQCACGNQWACEHVRSLKLEEPQP